LQNYGRFTASNFLPPALPLTVNTGHGWQYIRIINNSPYLLSIDVPGIGTVDMVEYWVEDVLVQKSYRGQIIITPSPNISNISSSTSNLISINAYAPGEISLPISQPLNSQAVNPTASGKPLFTATFGIGVSAGQHQALSVFNPPGSGVTCTFHSVRAFTTDTGNPICFLLLVPKADANFATAIVAESHDGSTTPRVSVTHCTGEDATTLSISSTVLDEYNIPANDIFDFLDFPDNTTLAPGNSLVLIFEEGVVTGKTYRITMKWAEDIIVPLPGGVPTTIATELINQNNPAPSPVILAAPSGDNSTAVQLMNNAQFTLGDVINPGFLSMLGPLLLNATGITVNNTGGSGTTTLTEFLSGNLKLILIEDSNFKNVTSTIDIAVPTPFTNFAIIISGDVAGFNTVQGGVLKNVNVLTALAAGGGTVTNQANHNTDSISFTPQGFDTIRLTSGNASAHNGIAILIGK